MSKILVIGIGNSMRRDDGVGIAVALAVEALRLPEVSVLTHHGEGADLMERWHGYRKVVVVDATHGSECGEIVIWDAVAAPLPVGRFPKGSHLFGLPESVEMARLLGRLPSSLAIVGIGGEDFSLGQGLSAPVQDAALNAVRLIRKLCILE